MSGSEMNCIICGCPHIVPYVTSNCFGLFRCSDCSLIFLPDPPNDLSKYYPDDYYGGNSSRGFLDRVYGELMGALELRKFKRICPSGRILDIGCGDGAFLAALGANPSWELHGIEISPSGYAMASAREGLTVYNKPLEECRFGEDSFDIVALRHVLEHVRDPLALLKEVKRVLKPGGLAVIRVPNIESVEAAIGGPDWLHVDLPRHLFHYSPRTVRRLLGKAGFEGVRVNHFLPEYRQVLYYSLVSWLKVRLGAGRVMRKLGLPLLPFTVALSYLFAVFGKSGTIEVYARK